MKKLYIIIIIGVLLISTAIYFKKCKGADPIEVTTEMPAKRDIVETVSANGKIQPEVELKITSDVSGEIVEMYVKEGERVTKGQMLCKINPDIYESALDKMNASVNSSKASFQNAKAQLEQAKANLANAESNYNRNKKLYDQKAISDQEFEAIKATYESAKATVQGAIETVKGAEFNISSAEASLKESKTNLNKTLIFAPVDGTVSKLSKEKGERVVGTATMEGTEILKLANLNEMEVSVDVNENDIVRVHKGDTSTVEVDAYSNRKFKGIVTEVANSANINGLSADQITNFTVKIRILQESYKDLVTDINPAPFRPGMSATVDIQTKTVTNVISVPLMAVSTRIDSTKIKKEDEEETQGSLVVNDDMKNKTKQPELEPQEVVFVYSEGKVKMVPVKTGSQNNEFIEIKSGITLKDEIVSGPYTAVAKRLKDKAKVEKKSKDDLFSVEVK